MRDSNQMLSLAGGTSIWRLEPTTLAPLPTNSQNRRLGYPRAGISRRTWHISNLEVSRSTSSITRHGSFFSSIPTCIQKRARDIYTRHARRTPSKPPREWKRKRQRRKKQQGAALTPAARNCFQTSFHPDDKGAHTENRQSLNNGKKERTTAPLEKSAASPTAPSPLTTPPYISEKDSAKKSDAP